MEIEKSDTLPRQLAAALLRDTILGSGAGEKDQTPVRKKSLAVSRLAPALPHPFQRATRIATMKSLSKRAKRRKPLKQPIRQIGKPTRQHQ